MTTLTITNARKNLGHWLRKAVQGEDIGIIDGGRIIALRPVEVESADYAAREYGVTGGELDRFVQVGNEEVSRARESGTLKPYHGSLDDLLGD